VESSELLRRRIDEASRHLPLEQLAISPQCGFGGLDHLVIPEGDQWRKFARLMEVADAVWGRG
jgi:5-methyltetrahydropteroyltriglutamate--homocysteine methyltransferase